MNNPFDESNLPKGMEYKGVNLNDNMSGIIKGDIKELDTKVYLKDINYVKIILDKLKEIEEFNINNISLAVNENEEIESSLNLILIIEKKLEKGEKYDPDTSTK